MMMMALALALQSGNHRVNAVETAYRAALGEAVSCQMAAAYDIVAGLKPEELSREPAAIKPIVMSITARCRSESFRHFDAIRAKVALDYPGMPKKREAASNAAIEGVAVEMAKQAIGWSLTAVDARQKLLSQAPAPTSGSKP